LSVIVPWDRAYRRAKVVRQGRRPLSGRFDGLLSDFDESFGVRPLWRRTKDYRKSLTGS